MKVRLGSLVASLVGGIMLASAWLPSADAQDVLKIGVVGPLTGPGAQWGLAQAGGVQIAAKEVNDKGGLKVGNKTYRIEVIAYDEQYKATIAVSAMQRLISQDGVRFIFGPLSSAGTLAVMDIVQESKVIAISGAYSRKALDKTKPYMFRVYSTPAEYAQPIIDWLKKNLRTDVRRVAIINPNDETGWDSDNLLSGTYSKNGYTVVAKELYERSVRDYQPLLTKILAEKPDIVELGTTPPASAGLVVRQARELGYKGHFVKIGGPGPRQIIEGAGKEAAEGVINYMMADEQNAGYGRLATEYKKMTGNDMNSIFVPWYDGAYILMASLQSAGTVTDTDKVRQSFAKVLPFKSVLGGNVRLGGNESYGIDNQFFTPSYIGIIKNGDVFSAGHAD